jgi:hypothetical protein
MLILFYVWCHRLDCIDHVSEFITPSVFEDNRLHNGPCRDLYNSYSLVVCGNYSQPKWNLKMDRDSPKRLKWILKSYDAITQNYDPQSFFINMRIYAP